MQFISHLIKRMRTHGVRGFTLIDVLVSVSIVTLITGLSISYSRSSEQQLRMFKSQALVVGAINRARAYAAERFIGKNVPVGSFACAFGVHFDPAAKKLIIFQDIKPATSIFTCLNSDGTYTPSDSFYSGAQETIEEVPLDGVLTMSIQSGGDDILFVPPDLTVMTNRTFPVVVRESSSYGGFSDTTIYAGGQISTR